MRKSQFAALGMFAFGVAVLGLASPEGASAQTETPTATVTPTLTITPAGSDPYLIPTRAADPYDFRCPWGTPEGWLTVTPSSLWDALCSQCWVVPTNTQLPSATFEAGTPTLTPTEGVTPTATATDHYYAGEVFTSPVTIEHPSGCYWAVEEWNLNFSDYIVGYSFHFENTSGGALSGMKPMQASSNALHVNTSMETQNHYAKFCLCENGPCAAMFEAAHIYDCTKYQQISDGAWWQPAGAGVRKLRFEAGYCGDGTFYMDYLQPLYYGGGLGGPTPTATPTSAPSYCAKVDPDEEREESFLWSKLIWGDKYCLDIGPYELLSIPWIAHICVQNISMGYLYIFGVKVFLDMILYVFGGVLIVRMIT